MKRLRILHIGKYFPPAPGGMETYLRDLMNVQMRHGLSVSAIVHSTDRLLSDSQEDFYPLPTEAYQVTRVARWFNLGYVPISPLIFLAFVKKIRSFQPDVIHIHYPNASALWLLLSPAARRVPWVIHWQSDILTKSSDWKLKAAYKIYGYFENKLLKKTARIIVTSPNYLFDSTTLSEFRQKCIVIPLGLDLRQLPSAASIKVRKDKSPDILYLGRLAAYKGLLDLLAAVHSLNGATCWIAGAGEMNVLLKREIKRLDLAERVRLIGEVTEDEKWCLYRNAGVFVLPSTEKTEAFGLVLLEAAHCDAKLVVTDIKGSGTAWVGRQLPQTFIAEPRNIEDLAEKISMALSLEKGISAKTKKTLGLPSLFNLETQIPQIQSVYAGLVPHAPVQSGS